MPLFFCYLVLKPWWGCNRCYAAADVVLDKSHNQHPVVCSCRSHQKAYFTPACATDLVSGSTRQQSHLVRRSLLWQMSCLGEILGQRKVCYATEVREPWAQTEPCLCPYITQPQACLCPRIFRGKLLLTGWSLSTPRPVSLAVQAAVLPRPTSAGAGRAHHLLTN